MRLNQFVAEKRRKLYDELMQGLPPREGTYDRELLREALAKGQPRMGTVRYMPYYILFEFIYTSPTSSPTVLTVQIDAPERIVYMPVPDWVVESIWQGEISGSYHFEKDAYRHIEEYTKTLSTEENKHWFTEVQQPLRRT